MIFKTSAQKALINKLAEIYGKQCNSYQCAYVGFSFDLSDLSDILCKLQSRFHFEPVFVEAIIFFFVFSIFTFEKSDNLPVDSSEDQENKKRKQRLDIATGTAFNWMTVELYWQREREMNKWNRKRETDSCVASYFELNCVFSEFPYKKTEFVKLESVVRTP